MVGKPVTLLGVLFAKGKITNISFIITLWEHGNSFLCSDRAFDDGVLKKPVWKMLS